MKARWPTILITGLALAVSLLIGLQIFEAVRPAPDVSVPNAVDVEIPDDTNLAFIPPVFRDIAEDNERLSLSGTSEPLAVMTLLNRGERLRQVRADKDGDWAFVVDVIPDQPMALDVDMYMESGLKFRADETVFRIPPPVIGEGEDIVSVQSALILVTAPGGPSRIVQSPFAAPLTDGPLGLGPVDYDDSGGVIFSGTSGVPGRVRIYGDGAVIGETQISEGGRWFFIAGDTLPEGPYTIAAELSTADGAKSRVTASFARLLPQDAIGSPFVVYGRNMWQVRRGLSGGGAQTTAIFSALPVVAIEN